MFPCGSDGSLPAVPRSTGCLTCVARKRRCDGQRPACRACERRKQPCGGYRRADVVFLSDGWRALGVAAGARSTKKAPNRRETDHRPELLSANAPTQTARAAAGVATDLVLCPSPTVDRSQLHVAFFLASFGTRPFQALDAIGQLFRHYLPLVSAEPWEARRHAWSPRTPVVFAVDALALGHFGTAQADSVAVQRSFRSYGMALQSMSAWLAEMKRADADMHDVSEEEWQHLAFFCLVMAFWEMKMSPASRHWEHHIRYLAAAILRRGTGHAYSKANFQLLASSALLLTLSTSEPIDWQQRSPVRSAWLVEIRSALAKVGNHELSADYEFYRSLDSLMTEAATIASTMAQFDELLTEKSLGTGSEDSSFTHALTNLYNTAEDILSRNEARLARWSLNVSETPLSSWLSMHPDMATDPTSGYFWSSINAREARSSFDTILTFRNMMEYNAIIIYWSIIITLRLLLSDMLTLMVDIDMEGIPANPLEKVEGHRIQLMKHALNVIRTICYATHTQSRAAAPFTITTAFQLAVDVLERERKLLQVTANGNEGRIQRCEDLRSLAVRYLRWAMQHRIPLKIDLGSHRNWEVASIA